MKISLEVSHPGEEPLSVLLQRQGSLPELPCGGRGRCGGCTVSLLHGRFLTDHGAEVDIEAGDAPVLSRSCRTKVLSRKAVVSIPERTLQTQLGFTAAAAPSVMSGLPPALAVDLGTTTIAAALIADGRVRAAAGIANPQRAYGDNIIDRIAAAMGSAAAAQELQQMIIPQAVRELCRRLCGADGTVQPSRLVLAGNTAMTLLAQGMDVRLIGRTPVDGAGRSSGASLQLPEFETVEFLPAVAGYLGGDTLAGLYSCGWLTDPEAPETALFVDLGTNCEIVLKKGGEFFAATAAAGPAFERCANTAAAGIIRSVSFDAVSGNLRCRLFGDVPAAEAHGICGAALVSLLAELRGQGILDVYGRFVPGELARRRLEVRKNGLPACRIAPQVALDEAEIAELITAKAAVCAGISLVMRAAGVRAEELSLVVLAGGFSAGLDAAAARKTGLLPLPETLDICSVGNAALGGVVQLCVSGTPAQELLRFRERFTVLDLAELPEFAAVYTDAMTLTEKSVS